jgi:hypothetical protein
MGFQVDRAAKIDFLVLVKGDRQKGSQVNPIAIPISALVKRGRQKGSHISALVQGGRQKGSHISALVKGNRQIGFQVD